MVVSDRIIPDECSECGADLDDEYDVRVYDVENPAESGYRNPVIEYSNELARGDGTIQLHYPTCPDCDPPDAPVTPSEGQHRIHLFQSGFFALLLGGMAATPPPASTGVDVVVAAVIAIVLGVVALGEFVQIARIREREKPDWKRQWEVEPVLADDDVDPIAEARDAYLRGEIDEDDLEERLAAHYHDDDRERDREKRVMER